MDLSEPDRAKLSKSVFNIPGTKAYQPSGQLLISSGIPSLDEIVGGGFPVGTVVLIQEDRYGTFAKVMLKYYLAEGVVNNHSLFMASQDSSTENIMRELPNVVDRDPEADFQRAIDNQPMKIAFMYQNQPGDEQPKDLSFGHHYDLSTTMPTDILEQVDVLHWKKTCSGDAPDTFLNSSYHDLLKSVKDKIRSGGFSLTDNTEKKSILRVAIHALGSPMWLLNDDVNLAFKRNRDLDMFIFCLRAIIRSALAVAVITVPAHLLEEGSMERCVHSSDIAVRLQAFQGTELEENSSLQEYSGYFHVLKVAAINSFVSKHPGSVEYTFKLRRKKFSIEVLHLPPDTSEPDSDKDGPPQLGCVSDSHKLFEF